MANSVTPELIDEQRAKGWVDFHPEDYCHRCGNPNVSSWWVDPYEWKLVYPDESPIVCPPCFVAAWEKAAGGRVSWELRVDPSTDGWRSTEGTP